MSTTKDTLLRRITRFDSLSEPHLVFTYPNEYVVTDHRGEHHFGTRQERDAWVLAGAHVQAHLDDQDE
jgi:hypothetical protein